MAKANEKHTATPWKIGKSYTDEIAIRECDTDDCVAVCCDLLEDEMEANAEFITRACNAHDALMEALQQCSGYIASTNPKDGAAYIKVAEVAITKAEGKQ